MKAGGVRPWCGILLALVLLCGCSASGDRRAAGSYGPPLGGPGAPVGPQWSASQIIAARPGVSGDEWQATYRLTPQNGESHDVSVTLGPDYLFLVERNTQAIIDRSLHRIIAIDGDRFASISGYAAPTFAAYEIANRATLRRAVASRKNDPPTIDPFWAEVELGIMQPTEPVPRVLVEAVPSGGGTLLRDGKEAARFTSSDIAIPEGRKDLLRLFLQQRVKLHPMLRDAIVETGRMPAVIVSQRPEGLELRRETWDLTGITAHPAVYPLPRAATPTINADAFFQKEILPTMLAAVAAPRPTKSLEDFRRAAAAAATRGDWADAVLIVLEAGLQYGEQPCTPEAGARKECLSLAAHRDEIRGNARASAFARASLVQDSDPAEAVRLWRGISRVGLSNPTLIDLFIANTLSSKGRKAGLSDPAEPARLFANALRGNPFIANIYKDIGDHYMHQMALITAWIAYDLGRALPGRTDTDNLSQITKFETSLRERYPAFF